MIRQKRSVSEIFKERASRTRSENLAETKAQTFQKNTFTVSALSKLFAISVKKYFLVCNVTTSTPSACLLFIKKRTFSHTSKMRLVGCARRFLN